MGVVTGTVVFFLVWWTTLFAVLPLGVRPDVDGHNTTGGWRGAPLRTRAGRVMLINTLVAIVIWAGIEALVRSDWISFRHGWWAMGGN